MGEIVQLRPGTLSVPETIKSDESIEAACLHAASTLAAAAVHWTTWISIPESRTLLNEAEPLMIELICHNRRHFSADHVRSIEILQDFDARIHAILSRVERIFTEIPRPPA